MSRSTMKFLMLATAMGLAFSMSPSRADEPTLAPDAITQVCKEMQEQKTYLLRVNKWRLFWDLLRVKFAPNSFAKPMIEIVDTAPGKRLPLPKDKFGQPGRPATGRNLIFSMEPPERMQTSPEALRARKRFAEVDREVRSMRGQLTYLVTARSTQECVARANSSSFDLKRFNRLAGEFASLEWVNRIHEGKQARYYIQKRLRSLGMKWELFSTSDLGMVIDAIRSNQVRNILIVTHASSDGRIVDAALSEYPARFFSDISPTIESISIYSCHGTKVRSYYKLKEQLAKFPTYHHRREVITPRSTYLLGQRDVVPMNSLGGFIKGVDKWLKWSPFDYEAPVAARARRYCSIEVRGLDIRKGGYLFLLNNEIVGAVNPDTTARLAQNGEAYRLSYPCALMDRPKNILVMRNSALNGVAEAAAPEAIRGTISASGGIRAELPLGTHYRRPDGRYQSSKWEIPMPGAQPVAPAVLGEAVSPLL